MKKSLGYLVALCLASSCGSLSDNRLSQQDQMRLAQEAAGLVKSFAGTLQPQLLSAIQHDGPAKAIEVCSVKAGEIATTLSAQSGWSIRRVSLQNRNPAAVPDAWEERVLKDFAARQQQGEPVDQMVYTEVVDGRFRYLQAQGVKPLCLGCHGENLAPAVQEALGKHYPADKATGYREGQVRGAFSLSKGL